MVRVFINFVDRYIGKSISEVLSKATVGATAVGGDSEDATQQENSSDNASNQPIKSSDANNYVIVGTLSDPKGVKPEWVTELIMGDKEDILSALMSCDIVIYHVTGLTSQIDEALWAVEALHEKISGFTSQKMFICISSVLTWAKTKPLDPEEPDVPFTEEDYRRRKPHPNFKNQIALEKVVTKLGKTDKSKFITYVIAAGLTYGQGEEIFHFMFKAAWHGNIPYLQVFGEGQNFIPTIHVLDLASVIINIADNRPKTKYILALDDSHNVLQEIVKAISLGLGPGKVKNVLKEDALLNREITQCDYDHLLVNIQMEASSVKDMSIEWKAEAGLVENITGVIKEYKEARHLQPIRVCVLGAPAVGKTFFCTQLCQHYKLHHIKIADVIKEAIENLERTAARADLDDASDDDLEEDGKAQQSQELLDLLKEDLEENGRYSNHYIIEFYKQKLRSMPCQNQGFVLDGFPKTYEQAKILFAPEEDGEEDEEQGDNLQYNKLTMPGTIISLDASDEFLKERVMNLPQIEVEGTHNTEEGFLRRLALFRSQNEDDVTVLNYFDELEFHPEHIDIEPDKSERKQNTFDKLCHLIGEPRNYGPTPEEKAEIERKTQEEMMKKEAQEREIREHLEQEERQLRAQREAEWNAQLELVLKEEKEMLETRSMPLRNYLMKHVMPTLTEGLIEACKVKPDDPIDYLAEYLFKHNPQID